MIGSLSWRTSLQLNNICSIIRTTFWNTPEIRHSPSFNREDGYLRMTVKSAKIKFNRIQINSFFTKKENWRFPPIVFVCIALSQIQQFSKETKWLKHQTWINQANNKCSQESNFFLASVYYYLSLGKNRRCLQQRKMTRKLQNIFKQCAALCA